MTKGDDWIRATGNMTFVNTMLKYTVLVLGIVLIFVSSLLITMVKKVNHITPLPIFIDRASGEARCVDYKVIDAQGEKRVPAEINDFVYNFLTDLYTFNKFTIKSNLENALLKTAKDAAGQVKAAIDLPKRADYLSRNVQGICEVNSISIISTTPDIKVQSIFTKKILSPEGDVLSRQKYIAVLRLKPIIRQKGNAHGLIVVEYRENPYIEKE